MTTSKKDDHRWQLYSSMPGFKGVNRKLDAAWNKAKKLKTPEEVRKAMWTEMGKYSDFGARDSEPRNRLYDMIEDLFGMDRNSYQP